MECNQGIKTPLYGAGIRQTLLYIAMHDVHFFAQISEGKIRMRIIHGYNDYIPWVMHAKKVGAHYTQ